VLYQLLHVLLWRFQSSFFTYYAALRILSMSIRSLCGWGEEAESYRRQLDWLRPAGRRSGGAVV